MSDKILFIAPYPFGQAPSQRFRFEQYINGLKKDGYEIDFSSFLDERGWETLYKKGKFHQKGFAMVRSFWRRFILLFRLKKYDYIFIHREASMIGPPIFEWIISKVLRKKYIYDFDDAIWLPNFSQANAKFQRLKAYWKVKKIIKWAEKVTVGNTFLKEYANRFNKNVSVIPTTIDLINSHTINTTQSKEKVIIGWTGTHTTIQYLKSIIPVLQKLEQKFDFSFRVISNQVPEFNLESLEFIKWNKESEIKDLSEINIGIMPMEDAIWTKGKCGFKGLQYMSLQIPAIMSPVGVNPSIIKHSVNGFLCKTDDEWFETLSSLLNDIDLRQKIGVEGQKTVKERFSVESNYKNYLKLFQS